MAVLRGERLWQIPVTATGTGEPVAHFTGEYGWLRTVARAGGLALADDVQHRWSGRSAGR